MKALMLAIKGTKKEDLEMKADVLVSKKLGTAKKRTPKKVPIFGGSGAPYWI